MATEVQFNDNSFKDLGKIAAITREIGVKAYKIYDVLTEKEKLAGTTYHLARVSDAGSYMLFKRIPNEEKYEFVEILRKAEAKDLPVAMVDFACKAIQGVDRSNHIYVSIADRDVHPVRKSGLEMVWYFIPRVEEIEIINKTS